MKKVFTIIAMLGCIFAVAQNVGIGTTSPGVKLTVAGGMASTPATAVAAAAVTIPSNTSVFYLTSASGTRTDALTMTAPTPGQYLTIYNLDGNAATFAGYTITASTGVMTFQYINGSWQAVSDNSYIGSGSYIKNQTSAAQTAGFDISGNGLIGGTLGIGGISPSSQLQVAGSTGGVTDYGILTVGDNATNNNGISMGYDATNNWAWLYARTHNVVGRTIDINNNIYATWGGGVGIGTSSPISALQSTGTLTVGPYASAGAVGMAQISTGGSSPINNRLTYGTDGTGWKFAISKNQGGTVTDQMIIADNGTVQISNLSGYDSRPVYANASGILTTSPSFGQTAISSTGLTQVTPFTYSSAGAQSWVVPTGVTQIYVKLWGGGGAGDYSGPGGGGGFVSGVLPVTAGNTLYILVGGGGATGRSNAIGGGGAGTGSTGGGGGGRSAIMSSSSNSDLVTAGGGGGGARDCSCYGGGGGGGLIGGTSGASNGHSAGTPGGQVAGGGTACSNGSNGATSASQYTGGNAATNVWGGGGGGGWYGGGAGGCSGDEGPGAGGSSYIANLNWNYPIRNEQGTFSNSVNTSAAANATYSPGGAYDPDYASGVGTGGAVNVAGGNGRVVIYY